MDRRAFARSFLALAAGPAALGPRESAAQVDPAVESLIAAGEMPMARGNPARTGEHPGPGPTGTPVVLWRFAANTAIASSPAVADGRILFGSDDGFLFAVDAQSGTADWVADLGARLRGTPAIRLGVVFVAAGAVNVIDLATGDSLSRFDDDPFRMTSSLAPIDHPTFGPTIFGAGIRGISGFIDARGQADGLLHWRHLVVNHVTTDPTIAEGSVFFGTLDGELTALDAATGEPRWQFATAGGIVTAPAVADGIVYVTAWAPAPGQQGTVVPNATGILYAVAAETGIPRWQTVIGSPVDSGPAIGNGTVVVGGADSVFAFEAATGSPRWRHQTDGLVRSSPSITDRIVFIGSGDERLYALDLRSGDPLWDISLAAPVDSDPAVVDGVVYVTCGNALVAIADR